MARLRLSTVVPAQVEAVYRYVATFGEDGPTDPSEFQEKYGEDIHQEGDAFVFTEDVTPYEDSPSEFATWRCTFDFPRSRYMEAVDSTWSHRRDTFEPDKSGTRWTVSYTTQDSFAKGILQFIAFKLFTNKPLRRNVVEPVMQHFQVEME